MTPLTTTGGGIFIDKAISGLNITNNVIANLQSATIGGVKIGNYSISGININSNRIRNITALPINLVGGTEDGNWSNSK